MAALFKNKVYCLTGGASGIGLATCKLLASRGAIVELADVQDELLKTAVKDITATGGNATGTVLNVRDRPAVEAWISGIVSRHGKLDGAANLAGVIGKQNGIARIEDIDDADWDFVSGVNLKGVLNCLRAQLKVMTSGASIVNAASVAGIMGLPLNASYCASKHGVVGLSRAAAKEYAAQNIRVNAIAPGPIDTPMAKQSNDISGISVLSVVPMGRLGTSVEVANLVCWLLSQDSSYITGTVQNVDGGWAN